MDVKTYYKILDYLGVVINNTKFEGHVFAVGGCERDRKLGNNIKDIDLVVDLPNGGIEFAKWLHEEGLTVWTPVVYQHFGTAMFTLKEFPDEELEAVQTRKECYHDMESRKPDTVYGTINDDCTRRDFTVNAFYRNITTCESLDINGKSQEDLENKIIRTCGDPEIIFSEDPLRVLRMVRFAARLEFEIEERTFECAKKYVDRLSIISEERINDEFFKMSYVDEFCKFKRALSLLWDLGAFKYIFPYLGTLGTEGRYDILSKLEKVWDITNYRPLPDRIVAAMLYNDPNAEMEMRMLRCTNDFVNNVMFIIHQAKEFKIEFENEEDYEENEGFIFRKYANRARGSTTLQSILMIGEPIIRDYFFVTPILKLNCLNAFEELQQENGKFYSYKLPVDGNEIMREANIPPCSKVKEYHDRLLNFAFANPDHCEKEDIMNYLKYIVKEDYER